MRSILWATACLLGLFGLFGLFGPPTAKATAQQNGHAAMPGLVNVREFGAVGDGTTDDTAAFQRALNEAGSAGGGVATAPAGKYMLRGRLTVPEGVTLEGVLRAPVTSMCGTVLYTVAGKGLENSEPFLTLKTNATVKGLVVFYPEQSKESPTPYPWCIRGTGYNCSVLDVLLMNPWQAVDFGTLPCGRHLIRGLNAQPIRRGIYVDRCFDIGRIEDVHLWPFWTVDDPKGPWIALTTKEGEGFIFGRSDWEYVTNSFGIGFGVGMRFIRSADSTLGPGNYLLSQSGIDESQTALLVEDAQTHAGISFSNSQLFGDVIVKPTNTGMIRFTGCGFFGSMNGKAGMAEARLAGSGRVSFENCTFHCIHPDNVGKTLLIAESGRLSIIGCQFVTSEFTTVNPIPLYLGPNVVSAVIVGNEFNGRMRLDNHSKGQVRIAENTSQTAAVYAAAVEGRGQLALGGIVPASEIAALVPNGDFERRDPAGRPLGWSPPAGDIAVGQSAVPLPKAWPGPMVVHCRPGRHNLPNGVLTRNLTLKPNTDYVLSGYMWNLPHGDERVLANMDIGVGTPGEMRLTIGPGLENAAAGYFVYRRFNTRSTGPNVTVRLFFEAQVKFKNAARVAAQWDRIAITEASKFRPPRRR